MTRDFLIEFNSEEDTNKCYETLSKIQDEDGKKLFGEIDKKSKSLFVTLSYPEDIKGKTFLGIKKNLLLEEELVFVAMKNGEHISNGKVFTSLSDLGFEKKEFDITELFFIVDTFFKKLLK
jgi:hypothetical protein